MLFSKTAHKNYFIILLLITILYTLFLSKYSFYAVDHETQLPSILHFFDNQLFQKDFEMQFINPVSVKMLPHLFLFVIAKISHLSVSPIYFIAYIVIIYSTLLLTYKISYILTKQRSSSLIVCIMLLLYERNSFLDSSSFNIMHFQVVPYFVAVPLHLLCFYLVLQKLYLPSVFICSLLFYIHGQISMFTIIPILTTIGFSSKKLTSVVKYLLLFSILVSPMLISLTCKFNPIAETLPKHSILELTMFRVPHHIFSRPWKLEVFMLIIFSIFIMLKFNKNRFKKEVSYWIYALIAIYISGIIFVRFIPVDFIMLLYCLRVDVFLRIFFFILLSFSLSDVVNSILQKNIFRKYSRLYLLFMVIQILLLIMIFIFSPPKFRLLKRIGYPYTPLTNLTDYIKNNTPKNSLFITYPFESSFRLYAQRSTVVNFKTNPIGWGSSLQDKWMERLHDLCNVKQFQARGLSVEKECFAGYKALSLEDFITLCDKYGADYFLTFLGQENINCKNLLVYRNSSGCLCRCPK